MSLLSCSAWTGQLHGGGHHAVWCLQLVLVVMICVVLLEWLLLLMGLTLVWLLPLVRLLMVW